MGSTSRDSPSSDVESPASRTAACAANRSLCRAAVPSSKRRCWQELLKELRRPQLATAGVRAAQYRLRTAALPCTHLYYARLHLACNARQLNLRADRTLDVEQLTRVCRITS